MKRPEAYGYDRLTIPRERRTADENQVPFGDAILFAGSSREVFPVAHHPQAAQRLPEELWQAAVDLAPPYSTHHIARALRLNYTDLKRRIGKRPPEEHAAEFIEIHMRQLLPTAPCVLELRCPKGFELKIHDFDRIQP